MKKISQQNIKHQPVRNNVYTGSTLGRLKMLFSRSSGSIPLSNISRDGNRATPLYIIGVTVLSGGKMFLLNVRAGASKNSTAKYNKTQ